VLHRRSRQRRADLRAVRFALLAFVAGDFYLDQLVALEIGVDLVQDGIAQPFAADHHHRVQAVGAGFELLALGGGKLFDVHGAF
jgi:hypothetical protein